MKFKTVFIVFLIGITGMVQAQSDVFTVVLDRGHGTIDKGVKAHNTSEYELLQSVVAQIAGDVKNDVQVIYYNEDAEYPTIEDRARAINALNPDLVISIHMGAGKNPRQGAIYYNTDSSYYFKSEKYAQELIQFLTKDAYYTTILTETASFKLLESVNAPAIQLEIGNMNSPRDVYYLQTNGVQRLQANFTSFLNSLN